MKKSNTELYREIRSLTFKLNRTHSRISALERELDKYYQLFDNIPPVASKLQSIEDVLSAANVSIQSRIDVCRSSVIELCTLLNKIIYEQENRKN